MRVEAKSTSYLPMELDLPTRLSLSWIVLILISLSQSCSGEFLETRVSHGFPYLATWQLTQFSQLRESHVARFLGSTAEVFVTQKLCFLYNKTSKEPGVWYSIFPNADRTSFKALAAAIPVVYGKADENQMKRHRSSLKGQLRSGQRKIVYPLVIVSPRDSHMGHFGHMALILSEVGRHLPDPGRKDVMLFFPQTDVLTKWAVGLAKVIFGSNLTIATRRHYPDVCFARVAMTLSSTFSPDTVDWLRERSHKLARAESVTKMQITIIQRRRKRVILNQDKVEGLLKQRFPNFAVKTISLDGKSFTEQVAVMQKTRLLVSPHGASLSNVIFLPANSTVIEITPYKFQYNGYKRTAESMGLKHYFWQSSVLNNTVHNNDCFRRLGFHKWSTGKCIHNVRCRFCSRDVLGLRVEEVEFSSFLMNMSNI